jgi:hypothetical protein
MISGYMTPLYKSTDGGSTWTEMRPSISSQWFWVDQVYRLRTVPGQPNVLWATTRYGIVKSEDGGSTWSLVFSQGGGTTCTDLEVSTTYSKVYAACRTPYWNVVAVDSNGIWSQLTQRSGVDSQQGRLALSKSDQRVIYFATFGDNTTNGPSYLGTVSRTGDGGQSWEVKYNRTQLTDQVSAAIPGDFDFECDAPGYGALAQGDNDIAVDPSDPNQLWIAGFEIFRSDNGGANFGRARARAEQVEDPALGLTQGMTQNHRYVSIAFPPNYNGTTVQTMFAAGRMGIERTTNARHRHRLRPPCPAHPRRRRASRGRRGTTDMPPRGWSTAT